MRKIATPLFAILFVASVGTASAANNGVPNNGETPGHSDLSNGKGGAPGGNQGHGNDKPVGNAADTVVG